MLQHNYLEAYKRIVPTYMLNILTLRCSILVSIRAREMMQLFYMHGRMHARRILASPNCQQLTLWALLVWAPSRDELICTSRRQSPFPWIPKYPRGCCISSCHCRSSFQDLSAPCFAAFSPLQSALNLNRCSGGGRIYHCTELRLPSLPLPDFQVKRTFISKLDSAV